MDPSQLALLREDMELTNTATMEEAAGNHPDLSSDFPVEPTI